jgi:hypothetical protein
MKRTQIFIIDIKRAYFNAAIGEDTPTFVDLPKEDPDRDRGMVGKLLVHMYGTRAARAGWHEDYSSHLTEEMGFKKGAASSCVFRHPERDLVSSVHGDDFATTGAKEDLDWFLTTLQERYELVESVFALAQAKRTTRKLVSSTEWCGGLSKAWSTKPTPGKSSTCLKTCTWRVRSLSVPLVARPARSNSLETPHCRRTRRRLSEQ